MKHPWTSAIAVAAVAAALLGAGVNHSRRETRSGLDYSNFDRSLRPQDDLYRFANGHWLQNTQIPADLSNYGAFGKLDEEAQAALRQLLEEAVKAGHPAASEERKAADLYTSFMDTGTIETGGLEPLQGELARIDAIASSDDVSAYIGANQRLGISEPMAWYVQQDARDATHYIAGITQNGLTMPDRDYYLREETRYADYRAKFEAYVGALLTLAGQNDAAAQARTIVNLEKQFAAAQWTRVQNRDPVATYNKVTLAEAAVLAPGINWTRFFEAVGAPVPQFLLDQPSFFTALGNMLQTVPVADWKIYFRYKLLDAYAPLLPEQFVQRHFDFHQRTLSGVQQQRPRWKRAVALADNVVGEITGRMYVERHFSADAKQRMQALVANLLRAYQQSIDTLEWMGPATRAAAREKLAKFTVKIGYPDKWRDYSALRVQANDLIGNSLRSAEFEHQRHVQRLGGPIDRGEWNMTPPTVNAYYNPLRNEIVFPAAILQPPFYDPTADDAVNYGGIGAVIGHEISHGFDDSGRQFDGDGNLRDWWTPEDAERYKARTQSLVAQYAAYKVLNGQPLNGELTLGENIADLSGLAIAYKAYHLSLNGRPGVTIDGYGADQRFFLGWSQIWRRKYRDDELQRRLSVDPHSPSEYRANGPPSNIEAFYAAFGVQQGDKLFRPNEQRVRIW